MPENDKSNEDNIVPSDASGSGSYSIVLPCDTEQFGEFVSGLLGKPQTISKMIHGIFEIEHQDIINTFHLVDQRIHQQNDSSLVQFTVKILYDDDSSILLNSLPDFEHHHEIRPIASIGVILSWTYLITFKNKNVPEKQIIDISFRSDDNESGTFVSEDGYIISKSRRWYGPTGIFIRIEHTERTWGVDIESLLTGHVKTLFKNPGETESFIYHNSVEIGLTTGILFFLGAITGVYLTSSNFIKSYLVKAQALVTETENSTTIFSSKLDFLIDIISTGAWPRFIFSVIVFLVISLIFSIILGVWVGTKANSKPASYVLLSKAAKDKKIIDISKLRRDWFMFSVSIVASIIAGIASNIIFTKYFGGIG